MVGRPRCTTDLEHTTSVPAHCDSNKYEIAPRTSSTAVASEVTRQELRWPETPAQLEGAAAAEVYAGWAATGSATESSGDDAGVADVGDDGLGAGEVRHWCIGRTPVTAAAALPSTAGPAAGRAWGPHDARGCRRGDSRACVVCLGIAANSTSHLWPERAGPRGVVVGDARYCRTIQRAEVGDRRRQRRTQSLFAPLHAPDRENIADSAHRIPPRAPNHYRFGFYLVLSSKTREREPPS